MTTNQDSIFSLISGSTRWSCKRVDVTCFAISLGKRLSVTAPITLVSALAIFGCSAENSIEQSQQAQQEKSHVANKSIRKEVGEASWYGPGFQGKETANGETFDQKDMTAAHPSLPMGTKAEVTNLENGKKVEVKINDRGPYADGRVIDLSGAAAKKLDMKKDGSAQVKIETTKKSSTKQVDKSK
jgi:rare lipoprotein A